MQRRLYVRMGFSKVMSHFREGTRFAVTEAIFCVSKDIIFIMWTILPAIIGGCTVLYRAFTGGAGVADSYRSCAIEIRNHTQHLELREPEYYLYSGVSTISPSPVISPNSSAFCEFRKTYNSFFGTSGLITYDIELLPDRLTSTVPLFKPNISSISNDSQIRGHQVITLEKYTQYPSRSAHLWKEEACLALMWSVPIIGVTSHALGIERAPFFTKSYLFQKLYYGREKWYNREAAGTCVKYEDVVHGVPISLFGSISNAGHASLRVDII